MAKNNNDLRTAKANKKDEFWTQIVDIENEMQHYKHHFEGKTVLCNCDDPLESNFFLYFALNFNHLKLKKLISTCYKDSAISKKKGLSHGYKIEVTEVKDLDGDDMITNKDIELLLKMNKPVELEGDGSFESPECVELLKECDICCTNPPFSRFRDFISLLMEYEKKFIVLGNINAVTTKEIFPLIKDNKIWLGYSIHSGDREFKVPDDYPLNAAGCRIDEEGNKYIRVKGVRWFSNLDHKKRHQKLDLYMEYNENKDYFPKYDNYDAININKTIEIPCDYDGVMGVPITFLDKYSPEQFEIIGGFNGYSQCDLENGQICGEMTPYIDKNGKQKSWRGPTVGKKTVYFRILIKRK